MKKNFLMFAIFSLLFSLSSHSNIIYATPQINPNDMNYAVNAKREYMKYYNREGGDYLGQKLTENILGERYFNYNIYSIIGSTIQNYYNQYLYALNSTSYANDFAQGPCIISAVTSVLKGLEVSKGYNESPYPLFGKNLGENYDSSDVHNNNFYNYWPDSTNITLSNNHYKNDDGFPFAVESENPYDISHVYNATIPVGYYLINTGEESIVTGIKNYLKNEKSNSSYRYSESIIDYYKIQVHDSSINDLQQYMKLQDFIRDGKVVLIGDNDFEWAGWGGANGFRGDYGGHCMLAVGWGYRRIQTENGYLYINEIIYDQGSGKYCAIPWFDIHDFFLIDLKLQYSEKYGLFDLFTRWVDYEANPS